MNEIIFGNIPDNAPSCVASRIHYRWSDHARTWFATVIFVDSTMVTLRRDTREEVQEIIESIRDDNAHTLSA